MDYLELETIGIRKICIVAWLVLVLGRRIEHLGVRFNKQRVEIALPSRRLYSHIVLTCDALAAMTINAPPSAKSLKNKVRSALFARSK